MTTYTIQTLKPSGEWVTVETVNDPIDADEIVEDLESFGELVRVITG